MQPAASAAPGLAVGPVCSVQGTAAVCALQTSSSACSHTSCVTMYILPARQALSVWDLPKATIHIVFCLKD